MAIKFILDENVDPVYQTQFLQKNPELVMWAIGDPGTPPKSTLDPEILCWCEAENFVLVTNNRKSMPVHLADHIAQGRHVPGILILNANLTIGETIEELTLIAEAAFEEEY
ncbi:MAG: DUF5615 family PIN-like protein [Hormoscilla sp. GM7CHS1pb]|nr:DUF5615 family PIN-like protein [Hormoscilla sp. GM7CHS1pb]